MSEVVDLDRLEAMAKAATPGPWAHFNDQGASSVLAVRPVSTVVQFDAASHADVAFIAALHPGTALALIAEVKRLRELVEEAYWEGVGDCRADVVSWLDSETKATLEAR